MEPKLPQNLDQDALNMAKAIRSVESNHRYDLKGASGEFGAYQFMPDTWKGHAAKYLGDVNAPLTPKNQDFVAYSEIKRLKDSGLTPAQISATWNSGSATGWENKRGVNKYGVAYDVPAYVNKVAGEYRKIKGSSFQMPQAPVVPEEKPRSLGGFVGNIFKSGGNLLKGTADALIHPVRTVETLGKIGLGTISNIGQFLGLDDGTGKNNQLVDQIAQMYKQRYGKDLGKTIYEDPVGVLADLSVILGGGAGLAGGVAKLGKATETANLASKVGGFASKIDPLMMAGRGLSKVGVTPTNIANKVGGFVGNTLGFTTGQGGQSVRGVFNAARSGADDAVNAMRGGVSQADVVAKARTGLGDFIKERGNKYQEQLKGLETSPHQFETQKIAETFNKKLADFGVDFLDDGTPDFTRSPGLGRYENDLMKLSKAIADWGSKEGDLSIVGMDKLKQVIDDFRIGSADSRKFDSFVTALRNETKNIVREGLKAKGDLKTLAKYDSLLSDFETKTKVAREIKQALSLGDNASPETTFTKLVQALKTDKVRRQELVGILEEFGGKEIMSEIAGLNMKDLIPKGLFSGAIGIGSVASGNIPALGLASPRLVGEVANITGKGLGKIERLKLPDNMAFRGGKKLGQQVYGKENLTRNSKLFQLYQLIKDAENETEQP